MRKMVTGASVVLLGLVLASGLQAGVPEEEVLVLTEPGTIAMPDGELLAAPDSVRAALEVIAVLQAIGTREVRVAMPEFRREDTMRVAPNGNVARLPDFANLFALRLSPGANRDSALARLKLLPWVVLAEKNQRAQELAVKPNDECFDPQQWNMDNHGQYQGTPDADVDAPEAWQYTTGSPTVILGIVDGIVDADHPEFGERLFGDEGDPDDHGTRVAGIAAATGNNSEGVAGLDWRARVCTQNRGQGTVNAAQAVIEAADAGSDVINCSWTFMFYSEVLYNAFSYALALGALPCAALPYDPAFEAPSDFGPWLLTVNATNAWDQRTQYGVEKRFADIAAPGGEGRGQVEHLVYSTLAENHGYGYGLGTSMAAPHATGLAGLLLAANPTLQNYDLEWLIKLGAEDKGTPGWDEYYGYGRQNAMQSVRLARPPYEVARGVPALTLVASNALVTFVESPRLPLLPQMYFCDIYAREVTVAHPYAEPPLGWFSLTGYSLENPNFAREYLLRETSGDAITLRTYFYWISRTVSGQPVEQWAPVAPDLVPPSYTLVGSRAFVGSSGIEEGQPLPWEHVVEISNGVDNWGACVTGEDAGIAPHGGSRMFRVCGTDTPKVEPVNDFISFRAFDCDIALGGACYLSYWMYVANSPGGLGHITLDGELQSGTRLKDWTRWGIIIDTSGQRIHPASHTMPQGQWVRCIFSLNPAAGEVLKSLSVVYDDGDPAETGQFTAYIDDVQITTEFPAKDVWYAHTFANGQDENFELGMSTNDHGGNPCNGGARIEVNGHGGGELWIDPAPGLQKDLASPIVIDPSDHLSWRQWDEGYALKLVLTVRPVSGPDQLLIYAKNSADSWDKQGWVNMGDPEQHYNVWEAFSRNVRDDFFAEYGVEAQSILNMRIEHYCHPNSNVEVGADVADLFIGPRWEPVADMPALPSARGAYLGAWLTYAADCGLMFAAKGNKRGDFYSVSASGGDWTALPPMPLGTELKWPYRGSRGCYDGQGHVYVTKGNNTQGFWRYDVQEQSWTQLDTVPRPPGGKRVKDGADIVYVEHSGTGYVYLLKGKNCDFLRYNTSTGEWQTQWNGSAHPAPAGQRAYWKEGSWLAYDGARYIYAHKARYHEMWRYDVVDEHWEPEPLPGMPFGGHGKKSKDGGSAAWLNGCIYALKGGNTQEFWMYDAAVTNSWIELDTVPSPVTAGRRTRVKGGGDIVAVNGLLYALKGNRTLEFWRYLPGPGGQFADAARNAVVPPGGQQTDGESPVMEGIEASTPRWRSQGTACTYCKDVNGTEQVFWRRYVPPGPEVQLSFGQGDAFDPCFDMSGNWVYFCREDSLGGGYTQVCRVAAAMVPPPVERLTFGPHDAAHVEVSPTNQWCAYDRETDDGHTAIFRIPAVGGQEQQLTQSGPWDDETPVWLDSSNLAFVRWPDNGDYAQLLKLNLQTMEVTVLTGAETDHEEPCPSYGGNFLTFSALDPSGTAQVGRVSATGGDETFLTSDQAFDIAEPDMSEDGVSIFAVRTVGPGSEIGLVDAQQGGYTALTDASAIRESPDCYYSTTLLTNFVIYSREALDGADGYYIRPKYRKGTGIFLCLRRRSQDGVQAGSFVFALEQMRPNPARGRVSIRWQVPTEGLASLKVYDASGRLVRTLHNGRTRPGAYRSVWNGRDDHNREVAAGIYFLTLEQNGDKLGRKVVLAE